MLKRCDIDANFLTYLIEIIENNGSSRKEIDLFLLNRLLHILNNNSHNRKQNPGDVVRQLEEDAENVSFYKPFYPYVRSFRARGENISQPYEPMYRSIQLSDTDTVDLIGEFYRDLGEDESSNYEDFLEDAEDHLKFIDTKSDIEGETTFINSTGDFFCLVPDYANLTKATILVHETTHIFDWFRRPDFIEQYLICEFNALFKEMLACDYAAAKLNLEDDNLKRRYYLHSLIKRYADDVYYRTQIIHLFKQDNVLHSMNKLCARFGDAYINYLMQDSLGENYIYQIAYLIAIELYTLYQIDKDKALWIAKRIVEKGNNNNVRRILDSNGIVLNEHSLEYENDLKLKLHI